MQDYRGNDRPGTVNGTVQRGVAGALVDSPDPAAGFDGSSGHVVGTPDSPMSNPTPYSVEAWFNTTSTMGGKLIGFSNQPSGLSSSYDRHAYLRDDGSLVFGACTGQENTVTSTAVSMTANWHYVVATQGKSGMVLYVDGTAVGDDPQSAAQSYTGYWRVGADRTWAGASSPYVDGVIDEAAVYTSVLKPSQVAEHTLWAQRKHRTRRRLTRPGTTRQPLPSPTGRSWVPTLRRGPPGRNPGLRLQ